MSKQLNWTTSRSAYLALVVITSGLVVGCGGTVSPQEYPSADALSIALTTLEGEEVRLTDFSGRVVLVDFWATWCAPCRAQSKILEELLPEYADQPVEFVAVDLGESPEKVGQFLQRSEISYPVWLDQSERLANALEIIGLPTLMIVGKEGDIEFLRFGVTSKGALRKEIAAALQLS